MLEAYSELSETPKWSSPRMFRCLILFLIIWKKYKPFQKVQTRLPLAPCFTQPDQDFVYIPILQYYQSIYAEIVVADCSRFQTVNTEHVQSWSTGHRRLQECFMNPTMTPSRLFFDKSLWSLKKLKHEYFNGKNAQ